MSIRVVDPGLRDLLARQHGTVARRQLIGELDLRRHDIDRMVRRRQLTGHATGVYVDHTGPLSWSQRAWVGVHALWPAALGHRSALPPALAERDGVIHVLVDRKRTVQAPNGIRVHRVAHLDQRVDWLRSPPRQRLADALIDAALAERSTASRFQVIADVLQTRQTTVDRVREALAARQRVPDRQQVAAMLDDLATGACSVLEREYLRLERGHGLPAADRQRRDRLGAGSVYRDVPYPAYGVIVELDGRAFHDTAIARDRDAERDLDTRLAEDAVTVRLTYGQVFDRGCATMAKIGALLHRRGWPGPLTGCPGCRRQPAVPR